MHRIFMRLHRDLMSIVMALNMTLRFDVVLRSRELVGGERRPALKLAANRKYHEQQDRCANNKHHHGQ